MFEREGVKQLSWRVGECTDQDNLVELARSQHGSLVARGAVWFSISTVSCSGAGKRWNRMDLTRTKALLGRYNGRRWTLGLWVCALV